MFKILRPKVYVNSVYNIDLKKLKKTKKIKGIIVDLDNTLVAWGKNEIDHKIMKFFKKCGFKCKLIDDENWGAETFYCAIKSIKKI